MSKNIEARPSCQHPTDKFFSDDWRDLAVIRRAHLREEHARREDSGWRKRSAAIVSGRFRDTDGFTDEDALDIYAPHASDTLQDRALTPTMEQRELDAWRVVESARLISRRQYVDACRSYLRLVDAMEKAAHNGIKPVSIRDLRKPGLHTLKLGAGRRRAA